MTKRSRAIRQMKLQSPLTPEELEQAKQIELENRGKDVVENIITSAGRTKVRAMVRSIFR